jgi:gliding motility-associated lipoprotein GldD
MRIVLVSLFTSFLAMMSCQQSKGTPKPRAYPRVTYPEQHYIAYNDENCPFHFEYPDFAEVKNKEEKCWFDLYMPVFKARIHCSYLPVENRTKFDDLVRDAYVIADRINDRANYMEESRILNQQGVSGVMLTWTGPAASSLHFFLTDTTNHFFKGALYFDSKVQPDSLAPIQKFIREDIDHMISTFDWESK